MLYETNYFENGIRHQDKNKDMKVKRGRLY